jgi:beta-glucosidase
VRHELRFPPAFRWGAATSAHQVEGGTTNNNWTRWEGHVRPDGRPGIYTGERCGQAADHWNRFESDLELMATLGLDLYRFSIEWSRVEPTEGRFDGGALDRYRSWCLQLRGAGIEPMVTLHHFTEPLWVTDRGGWEHAATPAAFERFVRHVVTALGDVVDWWLTVNEPAVYATAGWLLGEFPPGKRDPVAATRVLEHLLVGHARAYHAIHELDRTDADGDGAPCLVGVPKNLIIFRPRWRWNPLDRVAARIVHRFFNAAPLDAMTTGRVRLDIPGRVRRRATHRGLAGTLDYLGVNHYFRQLIGVDPRGLFALGLTFDETAEKSDMGWSLTPSSLAEAVRFAARYGKPLLVTEHGTADGDRPDHRRRRFLAESLAALSAAVADGVDVRAYVHWSLLDNFEWAHGFAPRFGLYRVDYATQERTLTSGGELYRDVIAGHRGRRG